MSELNEESGTTEETVESSWEDALARNLSALETESEESPPPIEAGNDAGEPAEVVEESEDALQPPEKWTDEQKEIFASLDHSAKQFLLNRHHDVESYLTKETQSLADVRKRYERLDEVLKPFDEVLKQKGIDITPHVANALQYYFSYQQDPSSTIKTLIKAAGLEQDQIFEDDQYTDPSIRALRNELDQTKRELAQMRSQPNQDATDAQRQLNDFRSATNEDGTPKYPHFESLRTVMAPIVADGKSMEEAYNEALWTLPDYRKSQLESRQKEAEKAAEAQRAQKVAKAKKAARTLPASDVDKTEGVPKVNGDWAAALQHTLSQMER